MTPGKSWRNCDRDEFDGAVSELGPLQDREQADIEFLFMLGISYGKLNRPDDAREILAQLRSGRIRRRGQRAWSSSRPGTGRYRVSVHARHFLWEAESPG